MVEMTSYRAEPIGSVTPEALRLTFEQAVPRLPSSADVDGMTQHRRFYADEGRRIVEAMLAALPGGLIDGILLALLDYKRNVFRVPV